MALNDEDLRELESARRARRTPSFIAYCRALDDAQRFGLPNPKPPSLSAQERLDELLLVS